MCCSLDAAAWPIRWLPWLKTAACCDACANLKGAFLTAVVSPEHLVLRPRRPHDDRCFVLVSLRSWRVLLISCSLFFGQILIIISMSVTLALAGEEQLGKDNVDASSGGACSAFVDLFKSLRNLPPAMFKVLAVTAVTWVRTHIHPSIHPSAFRSRNL